MANILKWIILYRCKPLNDELIKAQKCLFWGNFQKLILWNIPRAMSSTPLIFSFFRFIYWGFHHGKITFLRFRWSAFFLLALRKHDPQRIMPTKCLYYIWFLYWNQFWVRYSSALFASMCNNENALIYHHQSISSFVIWHCIDWSTPDTKANAQLLPMTIEWRI